MTVSNHMEKLNLGTLINSDLDDNINKSTTDLDN